MFAESFFYFDFPCVFCTRFIFRQCVLKWNYWVWIQALHVCSIFCQTKYVYGSLYGTQAFVRLADFSSKWILIDANMSTFFSSGAWNQCVMVLCGLFYCPLSVCRAVGVQPSFTSLVWRNSHIMIKHGGALFHWQPLSLLPSVKHKQTQLATGPAGYCT